MPKAETEKLKTGGNMGPFKVQMLDFQLRAAFLPTSDLPRPGFAHNTGDSQDDFIYCSSFGSALFTPCQFQVDKIPLYTSSGLFWFFLL